MSTTYAGQRLGLPEEGPGALAGWGRRILALVFDWVASLMVAAALVGPGATGGTGWQAWAPMMVFAVEATVLTALLGGSFGQLVTRLRVARVDGSALQVLPALLRTLLICLVVPPLVFNADQRGLHDLAVGTVVVRA